MRWPDSVLLGEEEVVVHVHPHWSTVVRPVVGLLVLVGAASFAAGAVPAGPWQTALRLVVAGVAVALALVTAIRPLLRWAATHRVLTTHRVLLRSGLLSRDERAVPLAGVVQVSVHRTLGQRLLGCGTVVVTSAGGGGSTVLERVPRAERFHRLLDELLDDQLAEVGGRVDDRPGGGFDEQEEPWTRRGPDRVADGWGSRVR